MIPITTIVTGRTTVSGEIKGRYGIHRPSTFSDYFRPVVFWNITYGCNLRCAHCYISADPDLRSKDLPTEEMLKIARQISELRLPLVIFSGGEPLLRKDFFQIAETIDPPTKLSLSTNGTLITEEVARRFQDLNFSYVGVSLDSVDPSRHDAFRGFRGAFRRAIRGIRNSKEAGLSVGIRTTLTKWNLGEVRDILEFASSNGIKRVSLYLLDSAGRGSQLVDLMPSTEDVRKLVDKLIEEVPNYDLEVLLVRMNFAGIYIADKLARSKEEFLNYLRMIEAQGECGRKSISIYPEGKVKPCQFLVDFDVGDLGEESLREILSPNNRKLKPFLNIDRFLRGPRCSHCPFRRICGGGSRNRALSHSGDFWGDDPLCFFDPGEIADRWGIDGAQDIIHP